MNIYLEKSASMQPRMDLPIWLTNHPTPSPQSRNYPCLDAKLLEGVLVGGVLGFAGVAAFDGQDAVEPGF